MERLLDILPEVIAALMAGGWLVSRSKRKKDEEEHRAKLAAMEAKITTSLRDSETKYTREALEIYTDNVVKPLRDEIRILRETQIRYQEAIKYATSCRLYPSCIILQRLQKSADGDHDDPGKI